MFTKHVSFDSKDKFGFNILHNAIANEHWKGETQEDNEWKGHYIIKRILNLPVIKLGAMDHQKNNALHLAFVHKKPMFFSFVKERAGTEEKKKKKMPKLMECLFQRNSAGNTPLHLACRKKKTHNSGQILS